MEHWQRLRAEFMALMAEEDKIVPQREPRHFLCAYGVYEEADEFGNWTLSHAAAENLRVSFELIASQAGWTLGVSPGKKPLSVWLHRLFLYLRENDDKYLCIRNNHSGGVIERVCEASAAFCGRRYIDSLNELAGVMPSERQHADPAAIPEDFVGPSKINNAPSHKTSVPGDRAALLDAYKREGKERGIRITDVMVARAANPKWNERTPVQRWKRNDPRCTAGDDTKIRSVLSKKPHLPH